MLKQPTLLVAVPLMGELIALAYVALGASYDKIGRIVRAAFRKWNDMIDVVFLAHLAIAPITSTFLSLILYLYVVCGVGAASSHFACSSTGLCCAVIEFAAKSVPILLDALWVLSSPLALLLTNFVAIVNTKCLLPLIDFLPILNAILAFLLQCMFVIAEAAFAIVSSEFVAIRSVLLSLLPPDLFTMPNKMLMGILAVSLWIVGVEFPASAIYFISVSCFVSTANFVTTFAVSTMVFDTAPYAFLAISHIVVMALALVFFRIASPSFSLSLQFSRTKRRPFLLFPFSLISITTFSALGAQFIFLSWKIEGGVLKVLLALRAAFKALGHVQHSVSLSLTHLCVLANGVSNRRSVISLANTYKYTALAWR